MVAPFFVFQLFTTCLWLLDDYWYYSLLQLGMLFFFEGTVVFQRMMNFKRLRAMRVSPQPIYVHRQGKWQQTTSDEVYPGDVVLISHNKAKSLNPNVKKKQSVPCDLLILSGSAVVNEAILTGESQPLVKDSIANLDDIQMSLDMNGEHKAHILHSGTEILQFTPSENLKDDVGQLADLPAGVSGIVCYVLKNGFETKQGKLMRVILFSQDRVSVEQPEVYAYLLILLVFALAASYYVLTESLKDPDRSRYKILLRCILIITNVVPPELPMQLSIAVNYSIIQLIQKQIFCTEPYRIPTAGKIDICCFDKTGTLTQNDLVIKGITAIGASSTDRKTLHAMDKVLAADKNTAIVIGGAHTLAFAEEALVGDPIEKQCFEGIKFSQNAQGLRESTGPQGLKITQVKKFAFNSTLKRMSVLAQVTDRDGTSLRVLSKGAPEVLSKLIKELPQDYTASYLQYVKNGGRVLALAYKHVPTMSHQEMLAYTREEAEKDLVFAGFIVAECPLKPDTLKVIKELKESSHEVKMITGDNALTAAFIGQTLSFGRGPSLFASEASP